MALVAYITTAGANLISECIGGSLVFTRAQLGSGGDTDAATCRARTALAAYEQDAQIARVTPSDGTAKVTIQYSNTSQQGTLTVKEIGIFGKMAGAANDILICYANFGSDPDTILPSSAALFARMYEIVIAVSGVASVTATVDSSAFQPLITVEGLVISDGNGNFTSVSENYYAVANHLHALTSPNITGVLPISKGGTNAATAAQALANLGVIYSATEPTYQEGAIWLQPVE